MHPFDTRLNRTLVENRIAEAERIAERDQSRSRSPNSLERIVTWLRETIENLRFRPPKLPTPTLGKPDHPHIQRG
jgi:hypothetical protein